MEFRVITAEDCEKFSDLIENLYANITNIEIFTPIPFDKLSVINLINNSRYYLYGAFDNDLMVGVICIDYNCNYILNLVDFNQNIDTSRMAEINFVVVRTDYRGQGIMKKLLKDTILKLQNEKIYTIFGKTGKFNFASITSFLKTGFSIMADYEQPFNKLDLKYLIDSKIIKPQLILSAKNLLNKYKNEKNAWSNFTILVKEI